MNSRPLLTQSDAEFPDEGREEELGEGGDLPAEAGEHLVLVQVVRAEQREGGRGEEAVRVHAHEVVAAGVQGRGLHQAVGEVVAEVAPPRPAAHPVAPGHGPQW